MALYFNMEKNLLRNGGRKAPIISEDDLIAMFGIALERFEEKGLDYDARFDTELKRWEVVFHEAMTEFPGEAPFQKVDEDLGKIDVDRENIILKQVVTGANGVPAIRGILGGDWEIPVVFFLYWDGKTFRGYIPTYGNSFNRHCKCAFGSEDMRYGKTCRKYHIVCGPAPTSEHEEDCEGGNYLFNEDLADEDRMRLEYGEEVDVTLTKENYESISFRNVYANLSACMEDFSSRVASTGKATAEETQKWHKALEKLAAKPVVDPDDYDDDEGYNPDNEEIRVTKPCPIANDKYLVSIQDGGFLAYGKFKLELQWENGEVVFVDTDLSDPVPDDVLKAEIDGLELTGPHRGRYKAKGVWNDLLEKRLPDEPGTREMYELLSLYGKSLKLGVEYETFLQIMRN